jgi:hypothetical protein
VLRRVVTLVSGPVATVLPWLAIGLGGGSSGYGALWGWCGPVDASRPTRLPSTSPWRPTPWRSWGGTWRCRGCACWTSGAGRGSSRRLSGRRERGTCRWTCGPSVTCAGTRRRCRYATVWSMCASPPTCSNMWRIPCGCCGRCCASPGRVGWSSCASPTGWDRWADTRRHPGTTSGASGRHGVTSAGAALPRPIGTAPRSSRSRSGGCCGGCGTPSGKAWRRHSRFSPDITPHGLTRSWECQGCGSS